MVQTTSKWRQDQQGVCSMILRKGFVYPSTACTAIHNRHDIPKLGTLGTADFVNLDS